MRIEKYLKEARNFDKLIQVSNTKQMGSKASVWVNGVKKYSGKVIGKWGEGFRFQDGKIEIDVELK
jgi:hypothetical protein